MLKQARGVEQALVGVGAPTPDATIVPMGYLGDTDLRRLRDIGIAGDILGQFSDASGKVVDLPIHDREFVAIRLLELERALQSGAPPA